MWLWIAGAVVVVLLAVVGIPYIAGQNANLNIPAPDFTNQEPQGGGPPTRDEVNQEMVDVTDIVMNPNDYTDTTVTLEGEADDLFSSTVFRLDQKGTVVGDEILVFSRSPIPIQVQADATDNILDDDPDVRVQGTVRMMNVVELERELDLDLDPEIETELDDREPVIIADQVVSLSNTQ